MKIFSVYDSKINAFTKPFFCRTKGEAMRGFIDEVNRTDSMLNKHPGDYTLMELGEWDDVKGDVSNHKTNSNICNGLEVLESAPPSQPLKAADC